MLKCNLYQETTAHHQCELDALYRFFLVSIFLYRDNYLRILHALDHTPLDWDDIRCDLFGLGDKDKVFDFDHMTPQTEKAQLKKFKTDLVAIYDNFIKNGVQFPEQLKVNAELMGDYLGLNEAEKFILLFTLVVRAMSGDFFNVFCLFPKKGNYLYWQTELAHFFTTMTAISQSEFEAALSPKGILTRADIIRLDPDNWNQYPSLDIRMRELKVNFFLTPKELAAKLNEQCRLVEPSNLQWQDFVHLQPTLDRLKVYLERVLQEERKGVNVLFYGKPGTGKTQLSRLIGSALDCDVYEVPSCDEDGDPIHDRRGILVRNQLWLAKKKNTLLVFDEAQDIFKNQNEGSIFSLFGQQKVVGQSKGWMNKMLEDNVTPTFWLTNSVEQMDPAYIRRFDFAIEVPIPPRVQRTKIITEATGGLVSEGFSHSLAEHDSIAPAVMTRAATVTREIVSQNPTLSVESILLDQINATLKAQGDKAVKISSRHQVEQLYDPALSTASVDLVELVQGVSDVQSARICLYGVPGTGKTAWARHLAEQLNKPLVVKKCSDLLDCYVGGSEKNIAGAFEQAQAEGAILLIDEVDSFLQKRSGAHRSWEVTQVNEMLTQMERFDGIFIATTNLLQGMDEACLRRFDLKVKFDYLDGDKAMRLFKHYCESMFGDEVLEPSLLEALRHLKTLAPGDFASVLRQSRFAPIKTQKAFYEALVGECRVKGGEQPRRIGF